MRALLCNCPQNVRSLKAVLVVKSHLVQPRSTCMSALRRPNSTSAKTIDSGPIHERREKDHFFWPLMTACFPKHEPQFRDECRGMERHDASARHPIPAPHRAADSEGTKEGFSLAVTRVPRLFSFCSRQSLVAPHFWQRSGTSSDFVSN